MIQPRTIDRWSMFLLTVVALGAWPQLMAAGEFDTGRAAGRSVVTMTNDAARAIESKTTRESVHKEVLDRETTRTSKSAAPAFVRPVLRPFANVADSVAVRLETRAARASLVAGREYLLGNQDEAAGYGLYSYVLFAAPPASTTRERYLMVIQSFQELLPDINILKETIPPNKLNITYLPVTSVPPTDPTVGPVTPEWLLDHYSYVRSKSLLAKLAGTHTQSIYLISTLKPLSGMDTAVKPYADQDLSSVPPKLVRIWVKEFFAQTSQETFWQPRTGEALVLNLRTIIATAALGMDDVVHALHDLGFPDIKDAFSKWITWKN